MTTLELPTILALVGIVILVAALLSGVIERSRFPQVALFLGLGATLSPAGLNVLNLNLDSPALRAVATLSLALVLFTDAISISIAEVRRNSTLTYLVLGPGTFLTVLLLGLAGWWLLGLNPAEAAIVGAALASTDPVLLRSLVQRPDIPDSARQALRLESGLNDIVLLPVVLVGMVFLESPGAAAFTAFDWAKLGLQLFVLGPSAGILIGVLAVSALDLVRRRIGIKRDYESLYSLGVAFTAFAAAELLHGSGFLAVFAAGLTIGALDVELCDCFLEYGETTAEMLLLFTFVLFGSSLIWQGFTVFNLATVSLVVLVLLIRPVLFVPLLSRTRLSRRSRWLISWFGPRGLSTLLLILLPVFENLPGSAHLFAICCLVVLFSVVVHGSSSMFVLKPSPQRRSPITDPPGLDETAAYEPEPLPPPPTPPELEETQPEPETLPGPPPVKAGATPKKINPLAVLEPDGRGKDEGEKAGLEEPREGSGPGKDGVEPKEATDPTSPSHLPIRITLEKVKNLWAAGEKVVVIDARTERSLIQSRARTGKALRLLPDRNAARQAAQLNLPKDAWLVVFCA
jgi:NhaP-type Na+/H+ or K+/H+ antiporter